MGATDRRDKVLNFIAVLGVVAMAAMVSYERAYNLLLREFNGHA
jgi:hypothetical protein